MRTWKWVFGLLPILVLGQSVSDVMLTIDLDNVVWYGNEATDPAKLMTSPGVTALPANFVYPFKSYLLFGDVVAVNGNPAQGAFIARGTWLALSTAAAPLPQRPIADINRNQIFDFLIEILATDGRQAGTLAGLGFGAGSAPPGTPPGSAAGNFAITGGSGAYAGVRGHGATVSTSNLRTASAVEDPAYRRVNGGGKWRIGVTLNAVVRPEIAGAYHGSDFSPVSADRPARAGETLVLAVRGMGPTRPVLEPGRTFSENALAAIASPCTATVNGLPAEVLNGVGWPGTADLYRVDVVLPGGTTPGTAGISLSTAWIPGVEFRLPVR
jgi:uncharacterized protein (TIGR03437 family)